MRIVPCVICPRERDWRPKLARNWYALLTGAICIVGMMCGCTPAGTTRPVIHWPPPPARPVLEFVGVYSSRDISSRGPLALLIDSLTGAKETGLRNPYGVVSDGRGRVYVSEVRTGKLVEFDFKTQRVNYVDTDPGGLFASPHGVALDSGGNIYATDTMMKRVVVLSPDGRYVRAMGDEKIFERPVHLAVHDKAGRVYVSDARRHNVTVFSLSGEFLFSFGKMGTGTGEFAMPYGVAVSKEGNVYVADMLNARIQVFNADGKFLRIIGNTPATGLELEFPRDIAFTSDGSLHIIDIKQALLFTCTQEGVLRFTVGDKRPSSHPLGFSSPSAMHIDSQDRIYIADQINNRFTVWQYLVDADDGKNRPL